MLEALYMTDKEAIDAVKSRGLAYTPFNIHHGETEDSKNCNHYWREIACDSETDVLECYYCGKQKLARCNFDDEYA